MKQRENQGENRTRYKCQTGQFQCQRQAGQQLQKAFPQKGDVHQRSPPVMLRRLRRSIASNPSCVIQVMHR